MLKKKHLKAHGLLNRPCSSTTFLLQVRGLTSTTGEGVINRTGVVAAVKSIVPLVTPSVPVPVVASSIPVVAAHGGGKRGQRALMGSHQHAAMKRGRGMGDHRDVNDVGNAVIKQEIKVDGETAYAAVSANSIHATQYQPGQQQVFGQYYETATSGNGENDTHGTTTTTFATADGTASLSHRILLLYCHCEDKAGVLQRSPLRRDTEMWLD